jgi:hypothetical protein
MNYTIERSGTRLYQPQAAEQRPVELVNSQEAGPSNAEIISAAVSLTSILLCGVELIPHEIEPIMEQLDTAHTILDIEHENDEKRQI